MRVLVIKDEFSRGFGAHVVPTGGDAEKWLVTQVARDIQKFGYFGRVMLKCDQENFVVDIAKEVAKARGGNMTEVPPTVHEHSAVGESQSNGMVERGVQTIEEQVRVFKLDLERKIGGVVPATHPIIPWMVEHSADVINKYHIGQDGKTPFERIKGKRFNGEMMEFGCRVWYRVPGEVVGGVMAPRWEEGIWLGSRFSSNEHIIGDRGGSVVKARAVRSRPVEESWSREELDRIRGVPWQPVPRPEEQAGEPQVIHPQPAEQQPDVPPPPPDGGYIPRGLLIKREYLEKYGYTQGCRKCRGILRGDESATRMSHTVVCRNRIIEAMKGDPELKERVERADERQQEWIARQVEAGDQPEAGGEAHGSGEAEGPGEDDQGQERAGGDDGHHGVHRPDHQGQG